MNLYQQAILDHYHNPRNAGKPVKFQYSKALENVSCGDAVEMFIDLDQDNKVTKISHVTEGCAICIAAASMLSEELIGKTKEELKKLDAEYVQDLMGIKLTISRIKCAHMPLEAIQQAVANKQQTKSAAVRVQSAA